MLKFFIVAFKLQGFFFTKGVMFQDGRISREKLLAASPT